MAYFWLQTVTKNQIVNAMFTALVLGPQLYVLSRPKSSRYCKEPLLNNLSASIVLSCIAAGFSVVFTLLEPVPLSVWRCYYMFGLLSFGHGLSTVILTLTAASCAKTTPELYYMSLVLTVVSIISTGFLVVKCALWLINRLDEDNEQEVTSAAPP
ncbi:uncharacterized protein LOC129410996 [Boleophthalmus pectinirostris]|uniref:uncharacterized protein LOC129410996 n=1 Tax=Boleophthalmus pectinirostris TaxID=150288 RepID=UPI00243277A9|nr:uncharacterized protein LOC129410996 [Boleophthalmus pectinirostris]